jgi:chemotaxis protein methyltransferase CheR
MYFTRESAAALVGRLARSLVPGGYLFLGYAETLRGLSFDFDLRSSDGTFYYERKADVAARSAPWPATASGDDEPPAVPEWFEAIRGATARIEALARKAAAPPPDRRGVR